jgi:hypothetical protein
MKKLPVLVREKLHYRRQRKQITQAHKTAREATNCKNCKLLKDCEKHRHGKEHSEKDEAEVNNEANEMLVAGEEISNEEWLRIELTKREPQSFEDIQEDLQKVRIYLYRSNYASHNIGM